ncbi:hypothetical protein MASR1M68_00140 [Elusimicrobiota bacterium]
MINILEKKSDENLEVAKECIKINRFNSAVSRMYYAAFQKIKGCILKDSKYCSCYPKIEHEGRIYQIFEHGIISVMIGHFLEYNKKSYDKDQCDITSVDIQFLYHKRKEADYYNNKIFEAKDNALIIEWLAKTEKIISFVNTNMNRMC